MKEMDVVSGPKFGIITALGKEYVAMKCLMDDGAEEDLGQLGKCFLGTIDSNEGGSHYIALAEAGMGNNMSAICAEKLGAKFPSIKTFLMVGIAGAVPNPDKPEDHVRLGDIVAAGDKGVVQYDMIKKSRSKTQRLHPPRAPQARIYKAAKALKRGELEGKHPWNEYIDHTISTLGLTWKRPHAEKDVLRSAQDQIIEHPADPNRRPNEPKIFLGTIASGNTLLKDPFIRDSLRDDLSAMAVEMEASGVADAGWSNDVPYYSVRGTCDYCDPYKNDDWQKYAAVAAAAFTKALFASIKGETLALSEVMDEYHKKKAKDIQAEDKKRWPYHIDRREFVEIFDYKYGDLENRDRKRGKVNCVDLLSAKILESPTFLVGNYGMGKTTIAQYLFVEFEKTVDRTRDHRLHPVFLSLNNADLKSYSSTKSLAQRVFEELSSCITISDHFVDEIERGLRRGSIVVIFDGIDEAQSDKRTPHKGFSHFLARNRNLRFLLTSRLEFHVFFDTFAVQFGGSVLTVELKYWKKPEWRDYFSKLGTIKEYKKRPAKLKKLRNDILETDKYKELPQRPLFLKMLTDLYVLDEDDAAKVKDPVLRSNLAFIYEKYLRWKIKDDLNRKDSLGIIDKLSPDKYCAVVFEIFRQIAVNLYENESLTKALDGVFYGPEAVRFSYNEYDAKYIERIIDNIDIIILNSTLFSTLSTGRVITKGNVVSPSLRFSHRSFLEYLVAFTLADDIVRDGSNVDQAKCGDVWKVFQTHEVSDHFQNEIGKRKRLYFKNMGDSQREIEMKGHLHKAFADVISSKTSYKGYDERLEEVLYYCGKFKIADADIRKELSFMADAGNLGDRVHMKYYRTACIALCYMGRYAYLEDFVDRVADDAKQPGKNGLFNMNKSIDVRYYGRTKIREKMESYVDSYIKRRQKYNLNILRIWGYFTSQDVATKEEYSRGLKKLAKVKRKAKMKNDFVVVMKKVDNHFRNMNK